MLNFQEITINDKKLFDSYLKDSNQQCSEMTFTNLFVWRKHYGFRYTLIGETLLLIATDTVRPFAFFPLQKNTKDFKEIAHTFNEYKNYCIQKGIPCFYDRVEQEKMRQLEKSGIHYNFSLNEPDSDYVYRTEKLKYLRGKSLDGKRNHIHRLEREHIVEYMPVKPESITSASDIMRKWFMAHRQWNDISENDSPEKTACKELLDNYEALGCRGGLLLVDHIPSAVTFGEMLNKDTAVIHFEKAVHFIDGAYPALNQHFVQEEWGHTQWINREQDLGLPGLRRSKQSYHPDRMIEKYTVYFP